jgi:nucleotide-binding universal stress UspA family protein
MLKNLIVNLAVEAKDDRAADYAISVAQKFGAHLTGTAFALKPVIPTMIIEVGTNVIDAAINENQRAAKATIDRFEALTKKQGVSSAAIGITETLVDAVERFARTARCYDLAIVAQAEPGTPGEQDLFIESALFTSSRPVLIVPYIQKSPAKFDRIVCCWDGSAPAARAIADAMPFLHKAKKIDLLMVTTAKTRNLTIVGTDMAQHLARHGLNVEIQQIKGADADIASVVLSYAADNETDFLVMGGYGHSRWRELVLGGATRGILSSMTIPTLMSH